MRISVVIPTYNEEKFIKNTLDSLTGQEIKADEIIVVDNYSQDQTVEIVKSFNVKIIQEHTTGIGDARNKGFNYAQYELIARCDADTIVPPDWIKKIKINFTGKIDALVGAADYFDITNKRVMNHKLISLMKLTLGHYPILGFNMAITKEMWEKVKNKVCLNDSTVHEDIDLGIHVHKEGGIIGYDPTLIVKTSARRIKNNFYSIYVEYPIRYMKTLWTNHR